MKILFLCGSLEFGKDGVGDYTRRLAGELIRQGQEASIIALNDRHISSIEQTEQEADGTNISVLRIPSCLSDGERYEAANKFIIEFNPEWVSLQYVPYSFQKRGLPFGLANALTKIGKGRKWHIMFHELWIGMEKKASWKSKFLGNIQIILTKKLIKKLAPQIVHTQTKLYQKQLGKLGVNALHLPLFSNVPVLHPLEKKRKEKEHLIVFGGIHYGSDILGFATWILKQEKDIGKKLQIDFIGKNGAELNNWIKTLEQYKISYCVHGTQNEDAISKLLSVANIGLTTTPHILTEKSGSVAAMQEHQLPVICIAREWVPKNININFTNNAVKWHPDLQLKDILKQKIGSHNLHKITTQFINELIN